MSEEERRRFLANASADADRLSQLLSRLLDLARADMAVAPEDAATRARRRRCSPSPTRIAAPASPSIVDLPPACRRSRRRAELIEAVLQTLIENSRQAGAAEVRIAAARRGDRGRASRVADDGPGIPPADRELHLRAVPHGRREQGGTGLGLSIARSLLASCGGTIATRPPRRGACFEVELTGRNCGRPKLASAEAGWGGRIRTCECRYQKPVPYHLATPQQA